MTGHEVPETASLLRRLALDQECSDEDRVDAVEALLNMDKRGTGLVATSEGPALAHSFPLTPVLADELVDALAEIVNGPAEWMHRAKAADLLSHAPATPRVERVLVKLLADSDNDVRSDAGRALVQLARLDESARERITDLLSAACKDPAFASPDEYEQRTGWDYAYDALWSARRA